MADGNEPTVEAGAEKDWSWRVGNRARNTDLGLLYEPGNFGDILKGTWARIISSGLQLEEGRESIVYLDPWCGAPDYPLLENTARRLEWIGRCPFIDSQRGWLEQGKVASTGTLVRETFIERGLAVELRVFDSDPQRLARWSEVPGAEALRLSSGEEALRDADVDLVLVDPYDFLATWKETLPALLSLAQASTVLVYIYNRAPRGGEPVRNYDRFRRELDETGSGYVIGRVASDIVLPRAFHEMLLLAPEGVTAPLEEELGRATRQLACKMSTTGCFESGGS